MEAIATQLKEYQSYKDRFKGERLFVCGNAPSIAEQYPLLEGEHTFAFNHFGLWDGMPFPPTFYGVGDWDIPAEWENPYVGVGWAGITGSLGGEMDKFYLREKEDPAATELDWTFVPIWPKTFYKDLMFTAPFQQEPPFGAGASTPINLGVQMGAYMGFDPIYLLGIEFGPRNTAVWGDSEEGKRLLSLKPDLPYNPSFLDGTNDAFYHLSARGIRLVNCTSSGRIHSTPVPYQDLAEVLA
jgi:hypothetical protein